MAKAAKSKLPKKQGRTAAKKVSAKIETKGMGAEIADVAGKISGVIKKSHVKESFNGSVHDAEKFMKQIMADSELLKKFVKIVRKSFTKNSKHKSAR